MKKEPEPTITDRWWLVALCVALGSVGLIALLYTFPTSRWVWAIAATSLLFAVVLYLNPRYRYWRRASACFGIAGVLAFVPTVVARANLDEIGAFEFVSEASPLLVLGFLCAGLFLAWLDSRPQSPSQSKGEATSTLNNVSIVNSPQSISGLSAAGDIVINQGISENTLLAAIDAQRILARHIEERSPIEMREPDEELLWRLVEDIKMARRKFEREEAVRLIADLQKRFDRDGRSWSKTLRTEALLLMAEEERGRIAEARALGKQVDLTALQALLRDLRDANP